MPSGAQAALPTTVNTVVTTNNINSYLYNFAVTNANGNPEGIVAEFFIPLFDSDAVTSFTSPVGWTGAVTTSGVGTYGAWTFGTNLPAANVDYSGFANYPVTNEFINPPFFLHFRATNAFANGIPNGAGLSFSFSSPYGPVAGPYDFLFAKFTGNGRTLLSTNYFVLDPFIPLSQSLQRIIIPEPASGLALLAAVGSVLSRRRRKS